MAAAEDFSNPKTLELAIKNPLFFDDINKRIPPFEMKQIAKSMKGWLPTGLVGDYSKFFVNPNNKSFISIQDADKKAFEWREVLPGEWEPNYITEFVDEVYFNPNGEHFIIKFMDGSAKYIYKNKNPIVLPPFKKVFFSNDGTFFVTLGIDNRICLDYSRQENT